MYFNGYFNFLKKKKNYFSVFEVNVICLYRVYHVEFVRFLCLTTVITSKPRDSLLYF